MQWAKCTIRACVAAGPVWEGCWPCAAVFCYSFLSLRPSAVKGYMQEETLAWRMAASK